MKTEILRIEILKIEILKIEILKIEILKQGFTSDKAPQRRRNV